MSPVHGAGLGKPPTHPPIMPKYAAYSHSLTSRQLSVLALVAQGLADKQIADRLGIAYETVRTHVTAILRKLRVDNRAAAGAWLGRQSAS
jgi:DNA-binding NarL/FixJ family response regulator